MKRFVNTADLDKTEWLRARKMGITGTDAGRPGFRGVCGEALYGADWIENEKSAGDFSE